MGSGPDERSPEARLLVADYRVTIDRWGGVVRLRASLGRDVMTLVLGVLALVIGGDLLLSGNHVLAGASAILAAAWLLLWLDEVSVVVTPDEIRATRRLARFKGFRLPLTPTPSVTLRCLRRGDWESLGHWVVTVSGSASHDLPWRLHNERDAERVAAWLRAEIEAARTPGTYRG